MLQAPRHTLAVDQLLIVCLGTSFLKYISSVKAIERHLKLLLHGSSRGGFALAGASLPATYRAPGPSCGNLCFDHFEHSLNQYRSRYFSSVVTEFSIDTLYI